MESVQFEHALQEADMETLYLYQDTCICVWSFADPLGDSMQRKWKHDLSGYLVDLRVYADIVSMLEQMQGFPLVISHDPRIER